MEYFGYNGILCKFKLDVWIIKKLRFVDQVVMELLYRTVRSMTLHSSI